MVRHPANVDPVNLLHDRLGHGTLSKSRLRRERGQRTGGKRERRLRKEESVEGAGVPSRRTRNEQGLEEAVASSARRYYCCWVA